MSDEPWTVGRLLAWTTGWLTERGSDSPRLDAEVLLAHVRGCLRIHLYTAFDEVVADEPRSRFRELVRRRGGGEPVAYLVGGREFYSLQLTVSPAVIRSGGGGVSSTGTSVSSESLIRGPSGSSRRPRNRSPFRGRPSRAR